MVLLMRGLVAAYLLSAFLATATPIRRINSLIVRDRDVHKPEVAELIPRAPLPPKRGLETLQPSPSESPSKRPLTAHLDIDSLRKRLDTITTQCALAAAKKNDGDEHNRLTLTAVTSIKELVDDIPNLLPHQDERRGKGEEGKDKEKAAVQTLLTYRFMLVSRYVASWDRPRNPMGAGTGMNGWKEKILPKHPKRPSEEGAEIRYITEQLNFIQWVLYHGNLQEGSHMTMAAYLSILFHDIKRFLNVEIKTLLPGMQVLSLDFGKETLDVKKMFPDPQAEPLSKKSLEDVEELGKMLTLAFKVLWHAKEKVAGWIPTTAKKESKFVFRGLEFALGKVEFALNEVGNKERMEFQAFKRLLDESLSKECLAGPIPTGLLNELVNGLVQVKIVDQQAVELELEKAYQTYKQKMNQVISLDTDQTLPMKRWGNLNTLVKKESYGPDP